MKITVNPNTKGYPIIVDRQYGEAFLKVEVEVSKDNIKEGEVISITSSGKYIIEIKEE